MVDQIHPHTAQADENVGHNEIGTVQVNSTTEIPKFEHCQQYNTVAHKCYDKGKQVEKYLAVVNSVYRTVLREVA